MYEKESNISGPMGFVILGLFLVNNLLWAILLYNLVGI